MLVHAWLAGVWFEPGLARMADGCWSGPFWALAAVALARCLGWTNLEGSTPSPAPVLGGCSCELELRELLEARKDLERFAALAFGLGLLAVLFAAVILLLCLALCGHVVCCARLLGRRVPQPAVSRSLPGGPSPTKSPARLADSEVLALLAAAEVRR